MSQLPTLHQFHESRLGSHRAIHGVTVAPVLEWPSAFNRKLLTSYFIVTSMSGADTRLHGREGPHISDLVGDYLHANCLGMTDYEWSGHTIPDLLS